MKICTSLLKLFLTVIFSLGSIFSPWKIYAFSTSERVYFQTPFTIDDSVVSLVRGDRSDSPSISTTIDVRAAISGIGERRGLAPCYWGLYLIAETDTLTVTLRHGNSDFGDILDRRQSFISFYKGNVELKRLEVEGFETSSDTYNTLRLNVDSQTRLLSVSGGGRRITDISDVELPFIPAEIKLWSKGELTVSSLALERRVSPQSSLATDWTVDALKEYFAASTDSTEGFWQYLDGENDPQYARLGGRYRLAIVKGGDGYDIIYIDGAETLASQWKPMMLKGGLKTTIFENHYDLEWIDSTFESIRRDIHASVSDGAILTLSFPLLKTTLRFSKMPVNK